MIKRMSMHRLTLIILLAWAPYGCGTVLWGGPPKKVVLRPTTLLDESELSRGMAPGTSTIEGQAFLKTVGDDVKYAAGDVVYLCPKPVGNYLVEVAKLREREDPPYVTVDYDKRAELACRSMKCSGDGHFCFKGVAAGEYLPSGQGARQESRPVLRGQGNCRRSNGRA